MGVEPKRQRIAPEEWCSLERLASVTEIHGDALEQMATWREDRSPLTSRTTQSLNLLNSMRLSRQRLSVRPRSSIAAAKCWGGGHEHLRQRSR